MKLFLTGLVLLFGSLSFTHAHASLKRPFEQFDTSSSEDLEAVTENQPNNEIEQIAEKQPRIDFEQAKVPFLNWETRIFMNTPIMVCLFTKLDISDILRLSALNRTLDNGLKQNFRVDELGEPQSEKSRFFGLFAFIIERDCRKKTSIENGNPLKRINVFMRNTPTLSDRSRRLLCPSRRQDPKCICTRCLVKNLTRELNEVLINPSPDEKCRISRIIGRNIVRWVPAFHERFESKALIPASNTEFDELSPDKRFDEWTARIRSEILALDFPSLKPQKEHEASPQTELDLVDPNLANFPAEAFDISITPFITPEIEAFLKDLDPMFQ